FQSCEFPAAEHDGFHIRRDRFTHSGAHHGRLACAAVAVRRQVPVLMAVRMVLTTGTLIAVATLGCASSLRAQAPADFPPKATGVFTPTAPPEIANGPVPR